MKKVNVGLIGFGTIGTGVVRAFTGKKAFIRKRTGLPIELAKVADINFRRRRSVSVPKNKRTGDARDILDDPSIDIVVELIGGIHPAKEFIMKALRNGKHVVTANKALLADSGREIFALAEKTGSSIKFEASVGGGIPVVKALGEDFAANRIQAIYGIINGTSNYILSEMEEHGSSFKAALRQAQRLGFAERDPSFDIQGVDSAHKIAILSLLSFGHYVPMKSVHTEGIENIEQCDVEYAREMGYTIKLLAIAKKHEQIIDVRVHPTLLSSRHLLASVRGPNNAIFIVGDMIGEGLLYGQGAGEKATASAVVSDIIDIAKYAVDGRKPAVPEFAFESDVRGMKKIGEVKGRYYIRFMADDKPGVLAAISGVLAKYRISIASVTQKERHAQHAVPIVMMTHEAIERDLRRALKEISRSSSICGKPVAIRAEM